MAKRKPVSKTPRQQEMLDKLAERLRHIRKQKGFPNYEKFSYEVGIGRSQYGEYENGNDIKFSTLIKLLDSIGMTLSEFFSEGF